MGRGVSAEHRWMIIGVHFYAWVDGGREGWIDRYHVGYEVIEILVQAYRVLDRGEKRRVRGDHGQFDQRKYVFLKLRHAQKGNKQTGEVQ